MTSRHFDHSVNTRACPRFPILTRSTILAACLVLSVHGCQQASRNKPPRLTTDELKSVEVYKEGVYTGYECVDFEKGIVSALRPREVPRPCGYSEARLSTPDLSRLRVMIDSAQSDLQAFEPNLQWFRGSPPLDSGTVLIITWQHKRVSLAVPPANLCSDLSASALRTYTTIAEISTTVTHLRFEYAGKAKTEDVLPDSKKMAEFEARSREAFHTSLPQGRVGW